MRCTLVAALLCLPLAARAEGPPLRIALFASFPPMAVAPAILATAGHQ